MLNIKKLRIRDLMEMKTHFGKSTIQEVFALVDSAEGELTDEAIEVTSYLAMLVKRQEYPDFTIADAYDLTFEELDALLADPTVTEEASSSTD